MPTKAYFFLQGIIKDRNRLFGINKTTGPVIRLKGVGLSRIIGDHNGVIGRVMVKARTIKTTINRVMVLTETGTVGISSIIISIGANSSNRVDKLPRVVDRLQINNKYPHDKYYKGGTDNKVL